MNEIKPSYPNKYYQSKHERFKGETICACECDCDLIMEKKGDKCFMCRDENDHANPVYSLN